MPDYGTLYHPGDYVFVRTDLSIDGRYHMEDSPSNHINVSQEMIDLGGQCVEIKDIYMSSLGPRYRIVEDCGVYQWTDEMFEGCAVIDEVCEPEDIDVLYDWF